MTHDHFEDRAADWEKNRQRIENVDNIARAMAERMAFTDTMEIMDFGSGTGLLLERVAPRVRRITAVDTSPAMNEQLERKRGTLPCELEILEIDLVNTPLDRRFDGIVSSMTLHHVEDVPALLRTFHGLLKDGGFIAMADLDREDGSFHADNAGVFHAGFEREAVAEAARGAGFVDVETCTASVIRKPQGDYPVLLLTGRKAPAPARVLP